MDHGLKETARPPRQRAFATADARHDRAWLRARLTGPGALYNLGNGLALAGGIGVSFAQGAEHAGFLQTVLAYLLGSPEALWLTISMLLFLMSGEIYHRAYQQGAVRHLVARGDFVSGLAAIVLTVALVKLGDTKAALLAGALLTFGKLGSAAVLSFLPSRVARWDPALRCVVVLSRIPSILALSLAVVPALQGRVSFDSVILPLIMIVCFSLWLWADLLLLRQR